MPAPRDSSDEDEDPTLGTYLYDLVSSATAVILVGALLFAVSGVWPPLVAIESASMEPHIEKGDLVFVMDSDRFPGPGHQADTGVVTASAAEESGYRQFHGPGDVVVYQPDGRSTVTPIIHRAVLYVENNESWVDRADPADISGEATCDAVKMCPAPNAGFITLGDNNPHYDQTSDLRGCEGICNPVKPEWVVGTAEASIPYLGYVRLRTGPIAA